MKEFLNSYRFLKDAEIDEVAKFATVKSLKKGTILVVKEKFAMKLLS